MLRPAGAVDIGGSRVDVVSDSEFVSKDSQVEVIRVEGSRVVVRPRKPATDVDESA